MTHPTYSEAIEQAAKVAECAFDDRPNSRSGHHSEMDWTDGYRDGTRAAAAAIRALKPSPATDAQDGRAWSLYAAITDILKNDERASWDRAIRNAIDIALASPPAPEVPPGWVLVPVEPTEAMASAGAEELFASVEQDWNDDARRIWSAMLAAALAGGSHG